jgi:hypothetical protein
MTRPLIEGHLAVARDLGVLEREIKKAGATAIGTAKSFHVKLSVNVTGEVDVLLAS